VGSPVAADGHIYFTSEEGETLVIRAGPEFDVVSNNNVGENVLTTPAISSGTFFIRGQQHIFALRESAGRSE
ncbi:MAG TPA: pyrrolo-quinoline quinone, partial [Planctomycetaceae bacterium]|nr:pyrrolo-quinoline quinone [Planctomycetaceae bacterium]